MRFLVVAIAALALAGCGQPQTTDTTPPPAENVPAWQLALGDAPEVVRPYSPETGLTALEGGTVAVGDNGGARVTTPTVHGAWAAMLTLGPDAMANRPMALRINVTAEKGALFLASSYKDAPSTAAPAQVTVNAGETTTIMLPVNRTNEPFLVVANGAASGVQSSGVVSSIELLAGPAAP